MAGARYVFGPVPSRRLGRSLGIDVVPLKVCNWNCVYCQLGRTSPLVTERAEHVPTGDVLAEMQEILPRACDALVDWVTFSGSGEPTLHRDLGLLIREAKELTPLPVAVLTNGSLLHRPEVRDELSAAHAILPSVSAGTEQTYLRIHRPAHGLPYDQFVAGLMAMRACYTGRLWPEVMLIDGVNDRGEELEAIATLLERLQPDAIDVLSPTRPPAEPWVRPAGGSA
ncbi:MAG: radical SAM protein, partial [Sandaracinaceae bacterium]|nr:radical SAM protein [Sandaracinaceae bacterium]